MKKKDNTKNELNIMRSKFLKGFIAFIIIFSIGLIKKTFQNDTFYTIKIGELIFNNGIDMMDHFSFHLNMAYTYPHWLYDCFIYLIYYIDGYRGIYLSTIIIFLVLMFLIFKVNRKVTNNNYSVAAFATVICALASSGFATARAQLVSFILFVLEVYFIEQFLNNRKKKYLLGLLFVSFLLCNIHVAVWPFYFILYLPYLAEYVISWGAKKISSNKKNKFISFLDNKFVLEKNDNIKMLFMIMLLSLITGLFTPIGDTPYTYLIKTMLGNSQDYIKEHQMMGWLESPFTIILAVETIFLACFSKVKLRDLFMISGLVLMSIVSVRHLSLLAVIGTICYARVFTSFVEMFTFNIDNVIVRFFNKKFVCFVSFLVVILFCFITTKIQLKEKYIDDTEYPTEAVKYIKENLDIDKIKIFNDYNFGSYLILKDIPVFIDSRADLYTKEFSGLKYDVFDDFYYIANNYREKFDFYGITHVLIYKEDNPLYGRLMHDVNYNSLYEDEYFILYERLDKSSVIITYN